MEAPILRISLFRQLNQPAANLSWPGGFPRTSPSAVIARFGNRLSREIMFPFRGLGTCSQSVLPRPEVDQCAFRLETPPTALTQQGPDNIGRKRVVGGFDPIERSWNY